MAPSTPGLGTCTKNPWKSHSKASAEREKQNCESFKRLFKIKVEQGSEQVKPRGSHKSNTLSQGSRASKERCICVCTCPESACWTQEALAKGVTVAVNDLLGSVLFKGKVSPFPFPPAFTLSVNINLWLRCFNTRVIGAIYVALNKNKYCGPPCRASSGP